MLWIAALFVFSSAWDPGAGEESKGGLDLDESWKEFKETFNKTYSKLGELLRRARWEENLVKIDRHNGEAARGLHNYTLRPNHLADLSPREYLKDVVTLTQSPRRKVDPDLVGDLLSLLGQPLPENVDYREKGFHTRAFNQKACGSCYAFSVAAALQAQVFLKKGIMREFSVQQIVDCTFPSGNMGCDGGSLSNTLRYLEKNTLEDSIFYPYLGRLGICKPSFLRSGSGVKVKKWAVLPARDEAGLAGALARWGPLPVSVNASPHTFQFYHEGLYDDPRCPSDSVNHAMLLVGYTPEAWILQNWWTESWGEKGYMRLKRRANRCGVANYAAFLTVH